MIEKFSTRKLHNSWNTRRRNKESNCIRWCWWWRLQRKVQDNSESDSQAVFIARQSASSFHSKMSHATTACNFWKTEVIRFIKKVAEQSTKRSPEKILHKSSVHPPPSGRNYSIFFTPTEKVDFAISAVAIHRNQSVWTFSIDFHCFIGRAISYRWKCSKNDRIRDIRIWIAANSSSIGQRLVSINSLVSITDEVNHSGFIFDKDHIECEILDSKIAKGIFKIIPTEFKRKICFLDEIQVFLCFHINKTQKHTMILSDLFDVELYDENFKIFNQVWEETLEVSVMIWKTMVLRSCTRGNKYRVIGGIGPPGWGPNAQKDFIQREFGGLGSIPA